MFRFWIINLPDIEILVSSTPVKYQDAIDFMENRVQEIHSGCANELLWFLEHENVYTLGTSADENDVIDAQGIDIIKSGRGGKVTYHGPGQRIIYIMLDLRKRGSDVRAFVCKVEKWIILALSELGIHGEIRDGRVGVWVENKIDDNIIREEKIAAIGLRIRRWISFHGVSINLNPDLVNFSNIVPCGLSADDFGVTSICKIKPNVTMQDLDNALKISFAKIFD
jgi:lipoyl(octanoyl) transferase